MLIYKATPAYRDNRLDNAGPGLEGVFYPQLGLMRYWEGSPELIIRGGWFTPRIREALNELGFLLLF